MVIARRSGRASARRAGLTSAVVLATAALLSACRAPEPPGPLAVALASPSAATSAVVELSGLSREEREALAADPPTPASWETLFRVGVEGAPGAPPPPAVSGRYEIADRVVRFTPAFPLEAGRRYHVRVDLSRLRREGERTLQTSVMLPAGPVAAPSTRVAGLSPAGDTVPENLLRIYVWFSAPMSRGSGLPHVRLFDERGEVRDAFLPVDGGFWNHDFTRYTLFFDPGRVKEGILPHERMGRPLVAGRVYRLAISRDWRDARGVPLVEPFEHRFRAGAAATRPLDIAAWRVGVPRPQTREPLVLEFPAPLDRALALRTIGAESAGGTAVDGEVSVDASDTRWQLVPREPWAPGRYAIVALDALEDPAGNRLGRAFEVPVDDRARAPAPARFTRAFDVVPAS